MDVVEPARRRRGRGREADRERREAKAILATVDFKKFIGELLGRNVRAPLLPHGGMGHDGRQISDSERHRRSYKSTETPLPRLPWMYSLCGRQRLRYLAYRPELRWTEVPTRRLRCGIRYHNPVQMRKSGREASPSVMLSGHACAVHDADAKLRELRLDSLLATKLYIPAPRPHRVPRPRLTARMEAGVGGAADAGLGAGRLRQVDAALGVDPRRRAGAVAWVSLDDGDDDPVRFLGYVVTALGRLRPGLGEDALTLLRHLQSPSRRSGWSRSSPGCSTRSMPRGEDLVLVLDDYHAVDSPAVHAAVQFLLDRLPPCLHLVLATRVDPPLAPLPAARPRPALRAARPRSPLHLPGGRRLPEPGDGPVAVDRRRRGAGGAHRGVGRGAPDGGPVARRAARRRAVHRPVHRQPPLRPRLPDRRGALPPAGSRCASSCCAPRS